MKKYNDEFLNKIRQDRQDGLTQSDLMARYKLDRMQIKYVYHLLRKRNNAPEQPHNNNQFEFGSVMKKSGDSVLANKILTVNNAQDLSADDVLTLFGYNPAEFKLNSFKYSEYGKDKATGKQLVSASVKISPIVQDAKPEKILDIINNQVQPVQPVNVRTITSTNDNIENLIVPLYDLRFGITDIDVAYMYLLNLQEMIKNKHYNHVLIIFGGDVFMTSAKTVKGTQLDHVDNVKALEDATEFFDDLIRDIHYHADHVDVENIGGSHDFDKSYVWMYGIAAKWKNYATFHLTTNTRNYFMLDNVMVAILYRDIATNKIANLMSVEAPEMWAKATSRIALSGHHHKNLVKKVVENDDGVTLYHCSTIRPEDRYEKNQGYTMADHKMEVFTTNKYRIMSVRYLYSDPISDDSKLTLDDSI
ncbi:hypothetical protein [Limosilactobacillus vaginalis]|uniref:hypothetical protein n=1 Tax=Limosilactobacillus vaginalis TaxID=1633 RepID=UPI0025A448EC|nr:hypothetical protein [Limosilactobacillus vaginalis]MDM8263948.1 hypothetical protein [Limosilactobacillus vaginalis]